MIGEIYLIINIIIGSLVGVGIYGATVVIDPVTYVEGDVFSDISGQITSTDGDIMDFAVDAGYECNDGPFTLIESTSTDIDGKYFIHTPGNSPTLTVGDCKVIVGFHKDVHNILAEQTYTVTPAPIVPTRL